MKKTQMQIILNIIYYYNMGKKSNLVADAFADLRRNSV